MKRNQRRIFAVDACIVATALARDSGAEDELDVADWLRLVWSEEHHAYGAVASCNIIVDAAEIPALLGVE